MRPCQGRSRGFKSRLPLQCFRPLTKASIIPASCSLTTRCAVQNIWVRAVSQPALNRAERPIPGRCCALPLFHVFTRSTKSRCASAMSPSSSCSSDACYSTACFSRHATCFRAINRHGFGRPDSSPFGSLASRVEVRAAQALADYGIGIGGTAPIA